MPRFNRKNGFDQFRLRSFGPSRDAVEQNFKAFIHVTTEPIAKLHRRAELSIFWGVICDVCANSNRVGRMFPQRITQPNPTRTCLYATFYQSRGTTFKPIFSPGSRRSSGRSLIRTSK